jgi:thiol-disulfide isomerase/thioredoxin
MRRGSCAGLMAVPLLLTAAAGDSGADTSRSTSLREVTIGDAVKSIDKNRGSVVIFHLYASWCPPCREELPELNELGRVFRDQKVKFILLSLDEKRSQLEAFLQKHRPLSFEPLVMMPIGADGLAAMRRAGMHFEGSIPFTAVFNPSGKLERQWSGAKHFDTYKAIVDKLLDSEKASQPTPTASTAPASTRPRGTAEPSTNAGPSLPTWAPYAVGGGVIALVLVVGLMAGQRRRPR